VELFLRPASTTGGGSSTIVAFYEPTRSKQFTVQQWKDWLMVTHDATVDYDKTQTIKSDIAHVFNPGRLVLVTISSGPGGMNVYLDGRAVQSFPNFKISRDEILGQIVVGTSPTDFQPWLGELYGLAVYSKSLTSADAFRHYQQWIDPNAGPADLESTIARYAFTDRSGREVRNEVASGPAMEIPATFSVPYKGFLQSVPTEFKTHRRYAFEVLTNIVGFLPLGVIVCAYFTWTRSRWWAILITTVACGLLSFVIEVLQYYIPRRGSGMTDILTNTLGAAVGAMLTQTGPISRLLLQLGLIGTVQQPTDE
jgi:VanZ family protein